MKQLLFALAFLGLVSTGYAQKRIVKTKTSLTGSTFYIKSVASNKYFDLPGYDQDAEKGNGSKIILWDHDAGADRKFKFKPAGEEYYYILAQHCNSRLDVEGCYPGKWFCDHYKNKNGAPIQIWSFSGSSDGVGKWKLEQVRKGQYMIRNQYSGKVIDASGDANKNGCKLTIWDAHKGDNQLWELIDVKTGARYEQ